MANKIVSKATIASLMFSALLTPQTLAAEPTPTRQTKPYTETLATTQLNTTENYTAHGKIFTDTYGQTNLYTHIQNTTPTKNLTIILGEESLTDNITGDILYTTPTRTHSHQQSWTDYTELNQHWIHELLETPPFDNYTNITWVGKEKAADFIADTIAQNPKHITHAILINGGEYTSSGLTQATYDQLLNLNITIKNTASEDAENIAHAYKSHGFQNVTTVE